MSRPGAGKRPPPRNHARPAQDSGDGPPGLAVRQTAAKLLAAVIDARTPLDALTDNEHGHPHYLALSERDRALARAILSSALRFRGTIAALLARRLERPLPVNATALSHILHVAAAQILFLDLPDSAAVDLAVTHAKSDPRTARFAALVNGVLRSLARAKEAELKPTLDGTVDAPGWFAARIEEAYGRDRARLIFERHRIEAPVDFTVKSDPELWAERLGGTVLPMGTVRVGKLHGPVKELPGFDEGSWWVQDAAASLPARLFGDVRGMRVGDLCAAPGGKTAQLAMAGADVTAIEVSRNRLARLQKNLDRLRLPARLVQADLRSYSPDAPFDAVLLDAPCSSTGTVRRHPDVPWTKSPDDIAKLAKLQAEMLGAAVRLTRPGGTIVFANCSLDPLEGETLLDGFLAGNGAVSADAVRASQAPGIAPFLTAEGRLRTTPADLDMGHPSMSGLDGFFATRLRRSA